MKYYSILISFFIWTFLFNDSFAVIKIDYDNETRDCSAIGPQCLGIIRSIEQKRDVINLRIATSAHVDDKKHYRDEWDLRYRFSKEEYRNLSFRTFEYIDYYINIKIPKLLYNIKENLSTDRVCQKLIESASDELDQRISDLEISLENFENEIERLSLEIEK